MFGGRFDKLVQSGQRLQEQVLAMQQQAMAMQEQALAQQARVEEAAHRAADGGGGDWRVDGEPVLDPSTWLLPPSDFVKRTSCTSCGAAKQLPTVREYLYCDFCGQLTDYDLRRAAETALMGLDIQHYAAVANQIGPDAERARKAGDVERFRTLQHQLHTAQTAHTPWAVPPRAWRDADYRRRWIHHSTAVAVAAAFDREQVAHADRVKGLSLRLQWRGGMGLGIVGGMVATVRRMATHGLDMANLTPKVEMASFWPLAEAVLAQVSHLQEVIAREGIAELDPDRPSPALADRMARSMLAQGWLTHMEPDDGEQFVQWLGLSHSYQRADAHGERRSCAGCGHDVTALPGASAVVCDSCGRRLDVATPQVECTGCGARISFPDGSTHEHCPFCQAENRRT